MVIRTLLDFPSAQVMPLLPLLLMVEELAHPMHIERVVAYTGRVFIVFVLFFAL